MSLFDNLSGYWFRMQDSLFPWMEERIGELTNKQLQLVTVLEIIRLEAFIQNCVGFPGRPLEDRIAIARAFVAKMVYNKRDIIRHPTTQCARWELPRSAFERQVTG